MKITIHDVAKRANVSVSTVSRVLNSKDRVSDETRKRVLKAIRALEFSPDHVARAMVTKKTETIALIIPHITNGYWAALAEVIQEVLWDKNYNLITYSSAYDPKKDVSFLKKVIDRNIDGVIYASYPYFQNHDAGERDEAIKRLLQLKIPVIGLEQAIPDVPCVLANNHQGVKQIMNHFVDMGHSRIAYIGSTKPPTDREMGYRNALLDHGIDVNENIMFSVKEFSPDFSRIGYEGMHELLTRNEKFTAVLCINDLVAFGAIKALDENGLRVPHDMSVAGFDNIEMSYFFKPALTTARQPIEEMAKAAGNLILSLLEGRLLEIGVSNILFNMDLIVRESSAALN